MQAHQAADEITATVPGEIAIHMGEDYILREIDKIGQIIRALLDKIGVLKSKHTPDTVYEAARSGMRDHLDMKLEELLDSDDIPATLVEKHGFSHDNLEQFIELLFETAKASDDTAERQKMVAAVRAVSAYLEKRGTVFSLGRYYILTELDKI